MLFHLALNSLLVFFILAMLVEFTLFLFQVNNCRIRYICRSIPILKLPFDLLVFTFCDENLFVNFNPFSCELYLQDFILSILPGTISAEIAPNQQLIIPMYLANQIHPMIFYSILAGIIAGALGLLLLRLKQALSFSKFFRSVLQYSEECDRKIENPRLKHIVETLKIKILVSTLVEVPAAANLHYILFPKDLIEEISQEEFEAILAHELEHLRWKDPVLKLANSIICALFWWIPTRWWLKRLESDQEQASDTGVHRYKIPRLALASGLLKVVSRTRRMKYELSALCPLDSAKGTHAERIKNLVSPKREHTYFVAWLAVCLTVLASLCFWIC